MATALDTEYHLFPEDFARAEANGINRRALRQRFYENGWDKERALTQPLRISRPKGVYAEWKDLAIKHGVKPGTFEMRVRKLKWDYHRAATTPTMTPAEALALHMPKERLIPNSIRELAKKNGINHRTLYYRVLVAKWDMVRAATERPWSKEQVARAGAEASIRVRGKDSSESTRNRPGRK